MNDIVTVGSAITGGVISLGILIPKIIAGFRRDNLNSDVALKQQDMVTGLQESYEKHLEAEAERHNALEARVSALERENHEQAIKITRLTLAVLILKNLLESNGIDIPDHVKEEVEELIKSRA